MTKGRWHGEAVTEGIRAAVTGGYNPSVTLRVTAPFATREPALSALGLAAVGGSASDAAAAVGGIDTSPLRGSSFLEFRRGVNLCGAEVAGGLDLDPVISSVFII